jgi:predicted helicase
MATFNEFIQSIKADGNDGKVFEKVFCKWFLENDPYWTTQVNRVWLFSESPIKWGPDNGTDLIFQHKNGEYWAVQAKCFIDTPRVRKADVDSFLSDSNRKIISKRLFLASINNMASTALRVCDGQEKPVIRYMLKDFESANIKYPAHISELETAEVKLKPTPDPHQKIAIDKVISEFKGNDLGQLIMACGTGKTLTTLWIKESLKAQSTIVFVPSLNLISQTLSEWAGAANQPFSALCVCSDNTAAEKANEDMPINEAPFIVASDIKDIKDFLSKAGHKVIFCTYQSSKLIAAVQADPSIHSFDLMIADEAHRCAGTSDAAFTKVLDRQAIKATKRLFTTATTRMYTDRYKSRAKEHGVEVFGMDDETIFGPEFHRYNFGEAITDKQLTDYQVVIVGVDHSMVKEWIDRQELISLKPESITDARTLAAKIGLLKAIKDYDLKRVISFHNRVKAAEDFASELSELIDFIEPKNKPNGSFWSSFVKGEMKAHDRVARIDKLKTLAGFDRGLLANAKCLSEGVDVPSLDGIAFMNPKRSQIDIIQSVGRAIRKVRGAKVQKKGTIVIPVFIEDGDNAVAKITASNFKPVWDVLRALRSHDEDFGERLDQLRTNMATGSGNTNEDWDDRVIFDLPITIDPTFSKAIKTVLVEAVTDSWEFWYGLLEIFYKREGHCIFPTQHKEDGHNLGQWASNQRRLKTLMPIKRKKKLADIGFIWSLKDHKFQVIMNYLKHYKKQYSNTIVKKRYIAEDGFELGKELESFRSNFKNGYYTTEQRALVYELGYVLDQKEEGFRIGFNYAKEFILNNKYPLIAVSYVAKDGFELGRWASMKRGAFKKETLPKDKISQLNSIGFVWDNEKEAFRIGALYFKEFITEFHHARVHNNYRHPDTYATGNWVALIRGKWKLNKLSKEQIKILDRLGFVWDADQADFDRSIVYLEAYKKTYGDCLVDGRFKTQDGYALGSWVYGLRKRRKKGFLTKEQIRTLDELGFVWDLKDK